MSGAPIVHVPQWVAFRAFGAFRCLFQIQAALDDVRGAASHGQFDVVAYEARHIALGCLSIRSLARGGEIDDDENNVSFDYFVGVSDEDITAALSLANQALDVNTHTIGEWLDRLQQYIVETERLLDYEKPLPVLTSTDGAFGFLGIARKWSPILEHLRLPPLMMSAGSVGAAPTSATDTQQR